MYSIGLVLSTRLGSIPFRKDYGCDLWEKEFSDMLTTNKADVRASLRNAIGKYERRLYNVTVSFTSEDLGEGHNLGMQVKVTGNYRDDDDELKFEAHYDLG